MRSIFPPLGTHLYHPPPVSMRSPLTGWQRFEHSRVGRRYISTYLFALIILTFRKTTLDFHDNFSIDITERSFPCMMILRQIQSCQHILLRSYRCWEASCNPDNQVFYKKTHPLVDANRAWSSVCRCEFCNRWGEAQGKERAKEAQLLHLLT